MGFDFSSTHIFVGDEEPSRLRSLLIEKIRQHLSERGFAPSAESEASRSVVVGPAMRWIFVGDSTGSTEDADPESFAALSSELAKLAPAVVVKMSDSAIVHLLLYRDGELADQFGNGEFPFFHFRSEATAEAFRGAPELWRPYLAGGHNLEALVDAWKQPTANDILSRATQVLGLDDRLAWTGYTCFDEQDEIKYTDWLESGGLDSHEFIEIHVAR